MILVDYRAGSHELVAPLQRIGLPVEETTLEFGDLAFTGRGEGGKNVSIGIEFKQLSELVASLRSGRLQGHQLPGMRDAYDYSWLLIEGELKFNKNGQLLRRVKRAGWRPMPGQMMVGEFLKRLFVLQLCGGLTPLWSQDRHSTLKLIEALYRTWTDHNLDEHKSHIAIYQPPTLLPISQFRRTVSTLPGIGIKLSGDVEKRFKGSIRRAVLAHPDDWMEIDGIGTKLATTIQETLK